MMDIVINNRGTYLHKKNDLFEIEFEGNKTKISPKKVKSIIIATSVQLTSDVILLAVINNIDILMLDEFGDPYGRFWHSKFGSTAYIRRRQIEIMESDKGMNFAKSWIINKINTSSDHLKELGYKRKTKKEEIDKVIEELNICTHKLEKLKGMVNEKRNIIMAIEGDAARKYFSMISDLMPARYKFNGRSSRPAKDEYNCMLNYAFGILYGKVEKACIIAGLDPYVGILHTDNYNKKSLVFDLIENYRHLAWKTIFRLFSKKQVKKIFFDEIHGGMKLNTEGKKVVVEEFFEELDKKILYKNRKTSNLDVMQFDCHSVANSLIEKDEK